MKVWRIKKYKYDIVSKLMDIGISRTAACVLANRGIRDKKTAEKFLDCPMEDMYDGMLFKDMDKGIRLIAAAIIKKKKIAIYGDYDVDGVMSTSILYRTLDFLGAEVMYYLPHRQKEGYGMNESAIEELKDEKAEVILACDNGIAAKNEIKKANELGIVCVILDHHEVPYKTDEYGAKSDDVPQAFAVIDAKQAGCGYPYKSLCAASMAFKFSKLLFEKLRVPFKLEKELLSLAAIATVCDIVDLTDENRIIVKNGLKAAKDTENAGLRALISQTGLEGREITEYHAGFVLGPCINATGRLESATLAVKLFTSNENAQENAAKLVNLNMQRKDMTNAAFESAKKKIISDKLEADKVLVIFDESVHESIMGIVAGRIKEIYNRPVIVITRGVNFAKGSGRSIEGYNMFDELFKCKELFERFGGHPMAAGLTLKEENVPILRKRLNDDCVLDEKDMAEVVMIDAQLGFEDFSTDLADELASFSPFGRLNQKPIFASRNIGVKQLNIIGKNKNVLKFLLEEKKTAKIVDAISFGGYDEYCAKLTEKIGAQAAEAVFKHLLAAPDMDIVYYLDKNQNPYTGNETVQLVIKDFRFREES